jgi:osmotically-inducible protein OsmY
MLNRFALIAILVLPLVSGCAAVAVGGAAATGVMVAEDRRTVGTMTEDEGIETKAASRISTKFPDTHVNVTSFNRVVLLTGEISSASAKEQAGRIAQAVENVRNVYNELQVAGNSSMSARANDSYLTSKVKTRFVDAQKFNPLHVKVVTENGITYLMGLVTHKEADAATEIARTTGGVQKVVRVFEYLD